MSPDAVKIAKAWWDEGKQWTPGVTSAVLADYLEENDQGVYEEELAWLRGLAPAGSYIGDIRGKLDYAAGVYGISTATAVDPALRRMLYDFHRELRRQGHHPQDINREACILLGEADAYRVSNSRELREYMMQSPDHIRRIGTEFDPENDLRMYGLPSRMYGWPLRLNVEQPEGQIDCVFRDVILTARVY